MGLDEWYWSIVGDQRCLLVAGTGSQEAPSYRGQQYREVPMLTQHLSSDRRTEPAHQVYAGVN